MIKLVLIESLKWYIINKHVDDHNITGIAQMSTATGFVLAQGTHQAEEQRENQIKQCSDGEQNLQTDIMHRTKPVADAHLCNSCDIDMLVDRHCFILLHLICYGSPPGGAISLVPLWFPWWITATKKILVLAVFEQNIKKIAGRLILQHSSLPLGFTTYRF